MGGVTLRPMGEAEFRAFVPRGRQVWAGDLVSSAGFDEESANARSIEDFDRLLSDGLSTPDHFLFMIVDELGTDIGTLWFSERVRGASRYCYLYDIRIDCSAQHRGAGRQAMLLLEGEARRRAYTSIELNVFGDNVVARSLYDNLGYRETFVKMLKVLAPDG